MKKQPPSKGLISQGEQYKFLYHVTNRLTRSLNHTLSIKDVTKLIVPRLADYCRIAMIDENNQITEIGVNHSDPNKVELATKLFEQYKNDPTVKMGIPHILTTARPEIMPRVDEKSLRAFKVDRAVLETIKKLGLKSYMGVPLIARKKLVGAMTFSSVTPGRIYNLNDLKFAQNIARRIAFALDSARLFKASQDELVERIMYEKQLRFLAEASKILSSSLDYTVTLTNVAQLAIDSLADWCAIDMLEKKEIKSVVIMHKNPKKVAYAKLIRKQQPPDLEKSGVGQVISSKTPLLYSAITPEFIAQTVKDPKVIEIIHKIGLYSLIIVPIVINTEAVGAITFISSTPKKQYTEADLQMAEEVASRAALAIENAKLYADSQKAVRLRDDFISIASHELKTPVTALKMHTQLLQRLVKNDTLSPITKSLEKVNYQINKLTGLITDLLDVSRIQQGKLQFREEPFDLNEAVLEVIENIQATNYNHSIILQGKVKKLVCGDKDRIEQVVINLLTNAVKYSPRAKKIVVKLISNKNHAKVTVKDYGIGIDKTHQKKIFRLFYRVGTPEADTYPGLGVGLYISNQIVKRHGGHFYVKSSPRRGSEFSFTLPYVSK